MRYFTKFWLYLFVFSLASFAPLVYAQQGPYHGRVIDEETKQPIIDAAVLAVWWKRAPAPHPIITYHDAQETLTDLNGNFTITETTEVPTDPNAQADEPRFYIFKPGYEAVGGRLLKPVPLEVQERLKAKDNLYEERGIMVVELRRLETREERLKNLGEIFIPSDVPDDKNPNLIRLRNIERANLGLKPTHTPKVRTTCRPAIRGEEKA